MNAEYTTADDVVVNQLAPKDSIVVGHDGSTGAAGALDFGFELAGALNLPLVIARSWTIDTARQAPAEEFGYVSSFAEISTAEDEALRLETRAVVEAHPSVEVDHRVILGQPAEALIALSARARMLVVGSRGLGGFRSLLLGSVSDQCVHHASCAVLVVRPKSVE